MYSFDNILLFFLLPLFVGDGDESDLRFFRDGEPSPLEDDDGVCADEDDEEGFVVVSL